MSYLFLDIDGVLNPQGRPIGDWRRKRVGSIYVWTSPNLGRWLNSLDTQIVWATTWIEYPRELIILSHELGLPTDLPQIDRLEWSAPIRMECGKQPGVERWLDKHGVDPLITPVVWADDQLGPAEMRWADAAGITAVKVPPIMGLADPAQRQLIESALIVRQTAL